MTSILATTTSVFVWVKGSNYVWRGNKFWGCEIYALSTTDWGGVNYIENNWFGGADHGDNGSARALASRLTRLLLGSTSPGSTRSQTWTGSRPTPARNHGGFAHHREPDR